MEDLIVAIHLQLLTLLIAILTVIVSPVVVQLGVLSMVLSVSISVILPQEKLVSKLRPRNPMRKSCMVVPMFAVLVIFMVL